MGELIGAALSQWFLTIISLIIVSKWIEGARGIFIASALSLVLGTLLRGLGMADGGSVKLLEGFLVSFIPQVAVSGFLLWNDSRKTSKLPLPDPATSPDSSKALEPVAIALPWHKRHLQTGVALLAFVGAYFVALEAVRYLRAPTASQLQQASHQGLLIARDELRKSLPKKLDSTTSLVDVVVAGSNLTYIHEIGSNYQITDISLLESQVKQRVCASEMVKSISQGVSYTYEYRGPLPEGRRWGQFTISSCP